MISRVVLNSSNQKELQTLAGANSSGLPVGSIIALYSSTCPFGYLPCNGSTYDTVQFPELYALLGTNKLPDFSECTLVGIGESSNEYDADTNPTGIKEHDVFVLGQFKDDQFQGHKHDRVVNFNDPGHSHNFRFGGGDNQAFITNNGSMSWNQTTSTDKTGITIDMTVENPTTDTVNGTPRTGSVTRQKSIGVNYVIKATPGVIENSAMPLADIAINYYTTLPTAEADVLGRVAFQKSDNRFYKCELNSGVYEWTELVTSDNDLIPYSQTPHYYDEDRWIIQVITLTNGKSQIKEGSLFTTAAYLMETAYFEESSADTFTPVSPYKAFWVDENGCHQITEIDVSAGIVISVELDGTTSINIDTADGYAYLNPDDTVTNGYCIFAENLNHVTALGGGSGNTTTFVGTYDEWNSLSEAQKNEYTQADIVDRFPPTEGESVPLGSTISYEGSTVPAGYLECDGSTFDADRYPALAMLLGSNVLPEIFDHDKLGDVETAPFTNPYGSTETMQYDGVYSVGISSTGSVNITINNVMVGQDSAPAGDACNATAEFKKGDVVKVQTNGTMQINAIRYYKKHMAIKATSSYASDTENTLFNQIKDYVDEIGTVYASNEFSVNSASWINQTATFPTPAPAGKYLIGLLQTSNGNVNGHCNVSRINKINGTNYSTELEHCINIETYSSYGTSSAMAAVPLVYNEAINNITVQIASTDTSVKCKLILTKL